ncbi:MAG TPA: hypothetical protein VIQ01_03825 [Burkholderiales bacterium]
MKLSVAALLGRDFAEQRCFLGAGNQTTGCCISLKSADLSATKLIVDGDGFFGPQSNLKRICIQTHCIVATAQFQPLTLLHHRPTYWLCAKQHNNFTQLGKRNRL